MAIMTTILPIAGSAAEGIPGWPAAVSEIQYLSSADTSRQPALFYAPETGGPKPLLVALHTWSGTYRQPEPTYARWCIQNGWCFIHPDFRGKNSTPEALGSELVVQDIVSAVRYACEACAIDTNRIYLVGVSGGGHAALLMAGRRPDIWAGVSAWCGISDIRRWWEEKIGGGYARNIEKACGGPPGTDSKAAQECVRRSPFTYLHNAGAVPLDINAGVQDGHTGSVPFTHSLNAFNAVAQDRDRLGARDIEQFYQDMKAPPSLEQSVTDPLYGAKQPLLRRMSRNVRVTIFNGGHEIVYPAALNWLAHQRKGSPAVWDIQKPVKLETSDADSTSGP